MIFLVQMMISQCARSEGIIIIGMISSHKKVYSDPSVETPCRDRSNGESQCLFLLRNKENYRYLVVQN